MGRVLPPRAWLGLLCGLCAIGLAAAAIGWGRTDGQLTVVPPPSPIQVADHGADGHGADGHPSRPAGPRGTVTLAFAGDVHFQLHLAALLDRPRGALGPITRTLAAADLTMVNLESSITDRGTPDAKELEMPRQRYYFRTSPEALDVLDAAGVDVVTMANNHGADYGPVGLRDTLAAIRTSPISVVGIGRDRKAAFAPYRVSVRGTDFAFLAADGSTREGASSVWAAGSTTPGIAAAHADRPRALLAAVRAASRQDDVVVVYLHWGAEYQGCPSHPQRTTAKALAEAGADVIVASNRKPLPEYSWSVRRIEPMLRHRMRFSQRPGCPVSLTDLRHLQMTYIGFDGKAHTGELAIHKDYAVQVASVFERLYDARWPIRRRLLVDDYGGNDSRSMAANNTSGLNCRRVAESRAWSAHAYGAAVDINPVQNPDVTGASVTPHAGDRFAAIDRSADAHPSTGVITANGPVVRAFARIGWEWGGAWSSRKDYQHSRHLKRVATSKAVEPVVTGHRNVSYAWHAHAPALR